MEQYFIYHIPKVKIGCSINPSKRVKAQGYEDFEILEVHTDIELASNREQELQRQYGYKVDCTSYSQSISIVVIGGKIGGPIAGKLGNREGKSKGGKILTSTVVTCPACNKSFQGPRGIWHVKNLSCLKKQSR